MTPGAPGEADGERLILTTSGDLAASMLGVALLLLAIVLPFRDSAEPTRPEGRTEIRELFLAVSGKPVSGGQTVEALRKRLLSPIPIPVIDVMPGRLRLEAPGQRGREVGAGAARRALDRFLRRLPPGAPVTLYVFDHGLYDEVRLAIEASDREWREVTPPEALRTGMQEGTGGDWSGGFRSLGAVAGDAERFGPALARHLAGEGREGGRGGGGGDGGVEPTDLVERLLHWWRVFVATVLLAVALILVALVERRRLRRLRRL